MGDDTTAARAVTPDAPRGLPVGAARSALASAVLLVALAAGSWSVGVGRAGAASETVDECVRRKVAAGETRSVALASCLAASNNTTVPPSGSPSLSTSSSDDGTSPVLLIAVGLGGAVVGAGIATALRSRRGPAIAAAPATSPSAPVSPAALHAMAPPAAGGQPPVPAMAPPSAGSTAPNGASAVLVTALIDLSDRVPSQALRAEILAALGRAGVHPMEPAVGDVFDVTHMRGVGGVAAPDAGWSGRIASVERAGFHDGVSVLRLPEVVVYTAGS